MKPHVITTTPAFILAIKMRRGEELVGPTGLLTRLFTLFSPEGGGGTWVLYRFYEVRNGIISFVFDEEQRAEVEKRLAVWRAEENSR